MKPRIYVIALRCGRLGNRLVLFANFIAHAAETKSRVSNVTFHSYADLFQATRRDLYCRFPVTARRSIFDYVPGLAPAMRKSRVCYRAVNWAAKLQDKWPVFGRSATVLREKPKTPVIWLDSPEVSAQTEPARLVFVYGWPFRVRSECLMRHAPEIRDYFRPARQFEEAAEGAVESLRARAEIVVGVHLRRGDYVQWRKGQYYFDAQRYARWMQEIAAQFPGRKTAFFVASDEAHGESQFAGLQVKLGAGSPLGEMTALSKCDYIIGPPSSFSQWASFYGDTPLLHLHSNEEKIALSRFAVSDLGDMFAGRR